MPAPQASNVRLRKQPGGTFAAATFSGVADAAAAARAQAGLMAALQRRGLTADGSDWVLARYNDPSTQPMFRRNEVLVPLKDFQLW